MRSSSHMVRGNRGAAKSDEVKRQEDTKWGKFWFEKLEAFHGANTEAEWKFSYNRVILFLHSFLGKNEPSRKRLKVKSL